MTVDLMDYYCVPQIVHPPLSRQSRRQLKECFDLMDADGSGAIDADELHAAFQARLSCS